jgi:hypothetical protein
VKITFGGDAAPNAAPIENRGKGFVRHPTFGRKDGPNDWTSKNSHPAFMATALAAHQEEIAKGIERGVYEATVRAIGGR